jgi:predicted signal transduction protein with EAL and GGDEF domain
MLLQLVAERLTSCVREADTVARLGGDECVVMLEDLSQNVDEAAAQAKTVGEKIVASLNNAYVLNGREYCSTPSVGITLFGDQHQAIEELLKQADLAMYQAKGAGRNTLRFFDPTMQAAVSAHALLESDLRQAVQEGQFILHYQAQVNAGGRLTGAEALIRWQHPRRGMVSPAHFIPLTEENGLILPLGHWVLKTVCKQLGAWATSPGMDHLIVAVNVSARQFRQADFVAQVRAVLEASSVNPARLKLELTESLVLEDVADTIEKMYAIKRLGVSFSMDDFGTGYSSLSYLAQLPLDQLKIDRSFVHNLPGKINDETIARTIITMGRGLAMEVMAEGVENEAQRQFLEAHGCHFYQGYLFSRPLPLEEFEAFARQVDANGLKD